jgi:hypothetical protein
LLGLRRTAKVRKDEDSDRGCTTRVCGKNPKTETRGYLASAAPLRERKLLYVKHKLINDKCDSVFQGVGEKITYTG